MELITFTGTNGSQHWLNPLQISRVTFTPASTSIPPPVIGDDGIPIPQLPVPVPPSLIIHMTSGFSIQVADSVDDITEKINREI